MQRLLKRIKRNDYVKRGGVNVENLTPRGKRFEEARRKAGKSMDTVAEETGLSKSMIQALEDNNNNRDVGYSNIVKLATCYGISTDYLLGLQNDDHYCANEKIKVLSEVYGKTEKEIVNELINEAFKRIPGSSFSERITHLRLESNMTQQKVADSIGISISSVGNYERGDRLPDIDVLVKYSKLFKCSTDYLLGVSTRRMATNMVFK